MPGSDRIGTTRGQTGRHAGNLWRLFANAVRVASGRMLNRNIIVPLASATAPRWNGLMELAQVHFAVRFDSNDAWHVTGFDRAASHPLLRQLEEREAPGLVLFSSGSTGESKAFGPRFRSAVGEVRDTRGRPIARSSFCCSTISAASTRCCTGSVTAGPSLPRASAIQTPYAPRSKRIGSSCCLRRRRSCGCC